MSHALDNRPLSVRLQARIEKYAGATVDPLVTDLALHTQSLAEITRLSAEVAVLSKNVIDFTREDFDATLNNLRRMGASIDGDNAYKRDLCDAIAGALAMGAQNTNPPPADHWGQRFWDIGREERAGCEELVAALSLAVDRWTLLANEFKHTTPEHDRELAEISKAKNAIAKATR